MKGSKDPDALVQQPVSQTYIIPTYIKKDLSESVYTTQVSARS